MNYERRRNRRMAVKRAKSNTERTRKRRAKMKSLGMKEVRFEVSETEHHGASILAEKLGYSNVTEYFRNEHLKKLQEFEIDLAKINKEIAERKQDEKLQSPEE